MSCVAVMMVMRYSTSFVRKFLWIDGIVVHCRIHFIIVTYNVMLLNYHLILFSVNQQYFLHCSNITILHIKTRKAKTT